MRYTGDTEGDTEAVIVGGGEDDDDGGGDGDGDDGRT